MTRTVLSAALSLLAIGAVELLAAPVSLQDPTTQVSSGWSVSWDESIVSVQVKEVDLSASSMTIVIDKNFGPYEVDGGQIEFPDALLTFTIDVGSGQTPVSRIIIERESIVNHTTAPWDRFDWIIMQTGAADFLVAESAGWDASPLKDRAWQDAVGNVAHRLTASNGVVAAGATFQPTGNLVIAAGGDAPFTLKQIPIPEPTSVALLGVAICALAARRRTRKKLN